MHQAQSTEETPEAITMKINIPKVVVPVNMVSYAEELQGQFLHVWVNPPMEKLNQYNQLLTDLQSQELQNAEQILFPPKAVVDNEVKAPVAGAIAQLKHWVGSKKEKPAEGIAQGLLDWYAEIWSQGPAETHWSAEELRTLEAQDPTFLSWMISQTWKARSEHIERKKKV